MKPYEEMSFEELATVQGGTVVYQCNYGILKGAILRNPSLCAYIGVPKWHNLAGVHYGGSVQADGETITVIDIDEIIDVHGGVTFSGDFDDRLPEGYWWFGWDHGHFGDATFYEYDPNPLIRESFQRIKTAWPDSSLHEWTVPEVREELERAMQQLTEYTAG